MTNIKISIAQLNPTVGDLDGNIAGILAAYENAGAADLLITPELSITGYPLEDFVEDKNFQSRLDSAFEKFITQIGKTAIIVGRPTFENGAIFNSAYTIQNGRIIGRADKRHLPNYGVFDEKRNFRHGKIDSRPVNINGTNVGIMICEDSWFPNVAADLRDNNSDILVSVNASPFRRGIMTSRINDVIGQRARETGLPIIYANQVGGQDELVFDGGSFAVNASGDLTLQMPRWKSDFATLETEKLTVIKPEYESEMSEIWNAAVLGTRDYYRKSKCFTGAVLGLSGGLDSALVLAIAADALGAENVHPVSLPSKYTADISNSLAQKMCDNLGIKMDTISIEPMVKTFSEHLTLTGVAAENLQARIRGNILMGLSNQNNWLLLSTGNKSEMAVGYATLYGDMAGGFNPLKDIYKTVAFDLCRWRNARGDGEIIPVGIINRPPSAELAPDQRDTDSLPDYPILDGILECIVEKQMAIDEIPYDTATVKRVYKMLARAEYKRRQAAPGVKITERALRGNDRRVPMVNGFQI